MAGAWRTSRATSAAADGGRHIAGDRGGRRHGPRRRGAALRPRMRFAGVMEPFPVPGGPLPRQSVAQRRGERALSSMLVGPGHADGPSCSAQTSPFARHTKGHLVSNREFCQPVPTRPQQVATRNLNPLTVSTSATAAYSLRGTQSVAVRRGTARAVRCRAGAAAARPAARGP